MPLEIPHDLLLRPWTDDSRLVVPGMLFIAVPNAHQVSYAKEAIAKGATVLLGSPALKEALKDVLTPDIAFVLQENIRETVAAFAAATHPTYPEICFAVTGTNGKSSVVSFAMQLLYFLGHKTASLGTLGVECYGVSSTLALSPLTTLGAKEFHQTLEALKALGVTHMAFEASSHGLDQYRLHRAPLTAACFTNLTQDHLDYHQTLEAYFEAKCKLFSEVLPIGKVAVLNQDSEFFAPLAAIALSRHQRIIAYGTKEDTTGMIPSETLRALKKEATTEGLKFTLFSSCHPGEEFPLFLPFRGLFQIENILGAIGLLRAVDIPLEDILPLLPQLKAVKGRLEFIGKSPSGAAVFVDYAHTPDALQSTLESLRAHMPLTPEGAEEGRLWLIFGCGGNRDSSKRPLMGQIADRYADEVVITDDNPRLEDPAAIRQEILQACPKGRETADRRQAIFQTISKVKAGDFLVIAGKGHETYQLVGKEVLAFDDAAIAQEAFEESN